jgi:hypothetical protein
MALTLESVNKGRIAQGLPPLDKLATDTTVIDKKPEGSEENKDGEAEKKPTPDTKTAEGGELTDDQLLELLGKRGVTVKSLDELKQKPASKSPEEEASEKETAKLTYGLQKGLFKKSEYESFIADNNAKENLVFSNFAAEAKADDPTLTDDEVMAEFKEKYGLDSEVGTRKHKRGAKEINVIANELLKSKYSKIYDADNKFSAFEQEQVSNATYSQNILAKTPDYKKNIEDAFAAVKIINDVAIPEEAITKLKNRFLEPAFIENGVNRAYTKEQIADQVRAAVVTDNFSYILEKHADAVLLAKKAGTQGIIPPGERRKDPPAPTKKLTDNQKLMYEEYQKNYPAQKTEQN